MITKQDELILQINETGFLPMYKNSIPGFSVAEMTPPEIWYTGDKENDPWCWKGPVIGRSGAAYGKFFCGKAAFISREWYPDFANYRRDGYDFDARYDDGLASSADKLVYDLIAENGSILSKELKRLGGFGSKGRKGFESIITRLQMQGYVIITNFEYQIDRNGREYGIALARYSTPENYFGSSFEQNVYRCDPEESKQRLTEHLKRLFPKAEEKHVTKFIG